MNIRKLSATASGDSHLYRELRFKIKQLSRQNGNQGETIHRLRAELAEVRELNGKIDRGELRRLERFEISARTKFDLDEERIECLRQEILRLREKLEVED